MSEDHPTNPKPSKPQKPYPDFPLTVHPSGKWCKKIKGKTVYFGRWDDPQGALAEYQAFLEGKPVKALSRPASENGKPQKPYPDFPLFAHASGQWCKKIRGKTVYFGKDAEAALKKYLEQKDDLHAGREPRPAEGELTVKQLCNKFLNAKRTLVDAGELSILTWNDYKLICEKLLAHVGKTRLVSDLGPDDFESFRKKLTRTWGPHRIVKSVQYVRSVFKHGLDSGLMDKPIRFGPVFKRPSKKTLRLHRAEQGVKMFEAHEVRCLLDAASQPMKCMILLGINAALGNADIGRLSTSHLDLENGWLNFPRPKTGVPRRAKLWPETVESIREALKIRPRAKHPEDKNLIFITHRGMPWHTGGTSPVGQEFKKLMNRIGVNHRKGLGYYTLRHVFRTIADGSRDSVACDFVMGHEVPNMSSVYRESVADERLEVVADYVHHWLFPSAKEEEE